MKNNFTPLVDYMNSFYFEEKRKEYLEISSNVKSVRVLIFKLVDFFEELLSQPSEQIKEVFILESAPEFIKMLEIYSAYGITPVKTERVISVSEKLISYIPQIEKYLPKLNDELSNLKQILNGELFEKKGSLSFPVIEKTDTESYGLMEELEISIHPNKKRNKIDFHIVPSLPKIEERLQKQIDYSWEYAVNYLKRRYKKFTPNLLVTIKYVNKLGIYEGNSLGIALTIGFIQELFKYYDLREEISIDSSISATGSMTINGEVGDVGKEIIRVKTEAVFYSPIDKFIIPQNDFNHANNRLSELLKQYPQRRLKLIPVMNIADVITRRDTLSIEKQNIITWGGRKVIKNKTTLIFSIIILAILFGFYYLNQDDNPVNYEFAGNKILFKNKYDKILWSKNTSPEIKNYIFNVSGMAQQKVRFIDVDKDGKNEVLIVGILNFPTRDPNLSLFNHHGKIIWSYSHYDSVATSEEIFTGSFESYGIIDTVQVGSKTELFTYFQHHNYYPTCIIKLDLMTGERLENALWHPGAIGGAVIMDWNQDGKKEIIAGGASNGMHSAYLFSIDVDKLTGTFPSSEEKRFLNMELADFNKYILFPMTDYGKLMFPNYNAVLGEPTFIDNMLGVSVFEGQADLLLSDFGYAIRFDKKLFPQNIVMGDAAINLRDKLVNEGKLKLPYTDTPEFHISILHEIQYWDGEKFVKYFNN